MSEWRDPTATETSEMVAYAFEMGLNEDHYDAYERRIDWDAVIASCEQMFEHVDLGSDLSSPTIRNIKRSYQRGRRSIIS